jgi:chromate transporter
MKTDNPLLELFKYFFKLGCISFGGPAAHIAMMEADLVVKRKWLSHEEFLDYIGATQIIPGPNSTEMTMHCGYHRAGWKGLFVAGASFIFPAVLITGILAYFYVTYGEKPEVQPFIYGIKPAVIAIILGALYNLGKKALKSKKLAILALITLGSCLLGLNEITAMFGCGFIGVIIYLVNKPSRTVNSFNPLIILSTTLSSIPKLKIFLIFLKVGAILYGSGYVLFAFLDAELVAKGLLSRQELIDAVAMGQFTPGPVLSTATFIGYQLSGFWGAILATIGIFLPSFILVGLLNPLIPKMRKSPVLSAFLDAINAASIAVIAVVCIHMASDTLADWKTISIAVISLFIVFGLKKLNSGFIVLLGSILGFLFTFV